MMIRQIKLSYGRELRARLSSVSGWLTIALNMLALLLCVTVIDLYGGYSTPEYAFETASLAFCITSPLLASASLASERKRGELELLLRYSDASALVLGKYLAHLTLLAPCALIALVLPPILSVFGSVYLPSAYIGAVGYILFGAAVSALSLYISCASHRPVICFFVGAAVIFSLNILSNIALNVTSSAAFTAIAAVLIALTALALFFYFDTPLPAASFTACATVITLILSATGALQETARSVIRFLSPQYSLSLFIYGAPELGAVLQLIFFTVIFLTLSVLRAKALERR